MLKNFFNFAIPVVILAVSPAFSSSFSDRPEMEKENLSTRTVASINKKLDGKNYGQELTYEGELFFPQNMCFGRLVEKLLESDFAKVRKLSYRHKMDWASSGSYSAIPSITTNVANYFVNLEQIDFSEGLSEKDILGYKNIFYNSTCSIQGAFDQKGHFKNKYFAESMFNVASWFDILPSLKEIIFVDGTVTRGKSLEAFKKRLEEANV